MQASEVETRSGRLRGAIRDGVHVFRGIPYAAPPTGALRFRPPAPVESWSGVRDATRPGPAAPQIPSPLSRIMGAGTETWDEDCLRLEVYTPGADDARRPVMVWLHGGGFTSGAGSQEIYDGSRIARRGDVVVVSVTYRLGILGWLPLEAFAAEEGGSAGNFGLQDQIAALEWVSANAAAFGGDPGNVTLFGESAGAMSVGVLLGCPAARGLFHAAILQSGAAHNVHDDDAAEQISAAVLEGLGLTRSETRALRDAPVERLLDVQKSILETPMPDLRQLKFQPYADGRVLPEAPLRAIRRGSAAGVRVIAGTNLDEYKLWSLTDRKLNELDEERLRRRCNHLIPGHGDRIVDAYRSARKGREDTSPRELWFAIEGDRLFRVPCIELLEAQAPHAADVHAYLFTWASPAFGGILGSCHALDVPFVFGGVDREPMARFVGEGETVRALSELMQDAWIAFARGGAPEGWPAYDTTDRHTWVLGEEPHLRSAPFDAERRAWQGVGPQ